MGHAAMLVIEDIMVRYARMQGKRTLWIPGTDHAAIATQSKVEKDILKKDGKNRHDLGRCAPKERVHAFAQESHNAIVYQVKRMGASLYWSREAYTLDDKREVAVRTAFKKIILSLASNETTLAEFFRLTQFPCFGRFFLAKHRRLLRSSYHVHQ